MSFIILTAKVSDSKKYVKITVNYSERTQVIVWHVKHFLNITVLVQSIWIDKPGNFKYEVLRNPFKHTRIIYAQYVKNCIYNDGEGNLTMEQQNKTKQQKHENILFRQSKC